MEYKGRREKGQQLQMQCVTKDLLCRCFGVLQRPELKCMMGKLCKLAKNRYLQTAAQPYIQRNTAVPSFSLDIFGGLHLYFVAKYDFSCGSYVSARLS